MNKNVLQTLFLFLVVGFIFLIIQKTAPVKYTRLTDERSVAKNETVRMLFVGDIMLDRSIRKVIDDKGFDYVFEDIKSIFENKDLVVGNLEGTITENPSIAVSNNKILRFTFATSTALQLKSLGFRGFSLANNHSLDFYTEGYQETLRNLDRVGIFSFGSPSNDINLSNSFNIKNEEICFVGFHSLYASSTDSVLSEIKRLSGETCTYIVIFAHWGEEYKDYENEEQREQAHSFIDTGADLVIGHHPHVIQPLEIYKGKAIFYSLGNFVFDQDFSLKTRQGIVVEVSLYERSQTFEIIPIEMYGGKLYFPKEEKFQSRMDILISKLPGILISTIKADNSFTLQR